MNLIKKVIALLLVTSFILPSVNWAFEGHNYVLIQPISVSYQGKKLTIPDKFGKTIASFQGQEKTIICIQDLHCNYEVQKNIAAMLDYLVSHHQLYLVGEEGAFDTVLPSEIKDFPHQSVKQAVADYFVKQGEITGAEYHAATAKQAILLEGIETPELYEQSYATIQQFLNAQNQGLIFDLRDKMDELKEEIYNQELKRLNQITRAYRQNELTLINFIGSLFKRAKKLGLETHYLVNLERYWKSKQINFDSSINPENLYQELSQLEKVIRDKYYTHEEQRQLDAYYHRLDGIEKLLNISATQEELNEFRNQRDQYQVQHFINFINSVGSQRTLKTGINDAMPLLTETDLFKLDKSLNHVERFYQLADERSEAFVTNLSKKMDSDNQSLAVMVHGGFHSDRILASLKQQGISYLLVKPQLSRQDVINPYFDLLQSKNRPLEQLLTKHQDIFALRTAWLRKAFKLESTTAIKIQAEIEGRVDASYNQRYPTIDITKVKVGRGWLLLKASIKGASQIIVTRAKLGLTQLKSKLPIVDIIKMKKNTIYFLNSDEAVREATERLEQKARSFTWQGSLFNSVSLFKLLGFKEQSGLYAITTFGAIATTTILSLVFVFSMLAINIGYANLAGPLSLGMSWPLASLIAGLAGLIITPVIAAPFLIMAVHLYLAQRTTTKRAITDEERQHLIAGWFKKDIIDKHRLDDNYSNGYAVADYIAQGEYAGKIAADLKAIAAMPRFVQQLILFHERAHQKQTMTRERSGRAPPSSLIAELYAYASQVASTVLLIINMIMDPIHILINTLLRPEREQIIEQMFELIPASMRQGMTKAEVLAQIRRSVIRDNSRDAYRKENKLPVTAVFEANAIEQYPGNKPRLIAVTKDHNFLAVNTVFGQAGNPNYVVGKGGFRWYQFSTLFNSGDLDLSDEKENDVKAELKSVLSEYHNESLDQLGEDYSEANILSLLNNLLKTKNFYQSVNTEQLGMHENINALINKSKSNQKLTLVETRLVNRAILQAILPTTLRKSQSIHQDPTEAKIKGLGTKPILVENADLAEAMEKKNPFWDVFFTGGKTVMLADSHHYPSPEDALRHKRSILKRWVGSSITAGVLTKHYVTGPDMQMTDDDMGFIVEEANNVQTDLYNQQPKKYSHYKNPVRATTSAPEEDGGFSHINWQVTSLGVLSSLLALLNHDEICKKFNIIRGEDGTIGIIIQGFGDVGSGLIKLLFAPILSNEDGIVELRGRKYNVSWKGQTVHLSDKATGREVEVESKKTGNINLFGQEFKVRKLDSGLTAFVPDYGIKILGVSDITGGIYNENGLEPEELLRLRKIVEDDGPASVSLQRDFQGLKKDLSGAELLKQQADVLIPAAAPAVFTHPSLPDFDQQAVDDGKAILIDDLQVKAIVEGSNNAVVRGGDQIMHEQKILFLPGQMCNGGGIYTSTKEFLHNVAEGTRTLVENMAARRIYVRDSIQELALANIEWVLGKLKASDYQLSPSQIQDELSAKINAEKNRLLDNPNSTLRRYFAGVKKIYKGAEDIMMSLAAARVARDKVMYEAESEAKMREWTFDIIENGDLIRLNELKAVMIAFRLSRLDYDMLKSQERQTLAKQLTQLVEDSSVRYRVRVLLVEALLNMAIHHRDVRENIVEIITHLSDKAINIHVKARAAWAKKALSALGVEFTAPPRPVTEVVKDVAAYATTRLPEDMRSQVSKLGVPALASSLIQQAITAGRQFLAKTEAYSFIKSRRRLLAADPDSDWAKSMVYNPAIIKDKQSGRLHMLFRAVGPMEKKRIKGQHAPYPASLGYAYSDDKGKTWSADFSKPALTPKLEYDIDKIRIKNSQGHEVDNHANGSIEDPRLFWMGDQCYMIAATRMFPSGAYWAYDYLPNTSPKWSKDEQQPYGKSASQNVSTNVLYKVDLESLAKGQYEKAFNYVANLTDPELGDNRDAVIFPEKIKINGQEKVIYLHRPNHPEKYIDSDQELKPSIVMSMAEAMDDISASNEHVLLAEPTFKWEQERIGIGAPPIRISETEWLINYYGKQDNKQGYSQSFMILEETQDGLPTIKHRCSEPILYPTQNWERSRKFKTPMLFVTGMIKQGKDLLISYGAADQRVGLAQLEYKGLIEFVRKFDEQGNRQDQDDEPRGKASRVIKSEGPAGEGELPVFSDNGASSATRQMTRWGKRMTTWLSQPIAAIAALFGSNAAIGDTVVKITENASEMWMPSFEGVTYVIVDAVVKLVIDYRYPIILAVEVLIIAILMRQIWVTRAQTKSGSSTFTTPSIESFSVEEQQLINALAHHLTNRMVKKLSTVQGAFVSTSQAHKISRKVYYDQQKKLKSRLTELAWAFKQSEQDGRTTAELSAYLTKGFFEQWDQAIVPIKEALKKAEDNEFTPGGVKKAVKTLHATDLFRRGEAVHVDINNYMQAKFGVYQDSTHLKIDLDENKKININQPGLDVALDLFMEQWTTKKTPNKKRSIEILNTSKLLGINLKEEFKLPASMILAEAEELENLHHNFTQAGQNDLGRPDYLAFLKVEVEAAGGKLTFKKDQYGQIVDVLIMLPLQISSNNLPNRLSVGITPTQFRSDQLRQKTKDDPPSLASTIEYNLELYNIKEDHSVLYYVYNFLIVLPSELLLFLPIPGMKWLCFFIVENIANSWFDIHLGEALDQRHRGTYPRQALKELFTSYQVSVGLLLIALSGASVLSMLNTVYIPVAVVVTLLTVIMWSNENAKAFVSFHAKLSPADKRRLAIIGFGLSMILFWPYLSFMAFGSFSMSFYFFSLGIDSWYMALVYGAGFNIAVHGVYNIVAIAKRWRLASVTTGPRKLKTEELLFVIVYANSLKDAFLNDIRAMRTPFVEGSIPYDDINDFYQRQNKNILNLLINLTKQYLEDEQEDQTIQKLIKYLIKGYNGEWDRKFALLKRDLQDVKLDDFISGRKGMVEASIKELDDLSAAIKQIFSSEPRDQETVDVGQYFEDKFAHQHQQVNVRNEGNVNININKRFFDFAIDLVTRTWGPRGTIEIGNIVTMESDGQAVIIISDYKYPVKADYLLENLINPEQVAQLELEAPYDLKGKLEFSMEDILQLPFIEQGRYTGVGFPLLAKVIEDAGGQVTLTNNSDNGITLTVTVPIAQAAKEDKVRQPKVKRIDTRLKTSAIISFILGGSILGKSINTEFLELIVAAVVILAVIMTMDYLIKLVLTMINSKRINETESKGAKSPVDVYEFKDFDFSNESALIAAKAIVKKHTRPNGIIPVYYDEKKIDESLITRFVIIGLMTGVLIEKDEKIMFAPNRRAEDVVNAIKTERRNNHKKQYSKFKDKEQRIAIYDYQFKKNEKPLITLPAYEFEKAYRSGVIVEGDNNKIRLLPNSNVDLLIMHLIWSLINIDKLSGTRIKFDLLQIKVVMLVLLQHKIDIINIADNFDFTTVAEEVNQILGLDPMQSLQAQDIKQMVKLLKEGYPAKPTDTRSSSRLESNAIVALLIGLPIIGNAALKASLLDWIIVGGLIGLAIAGGYYLGKWLLANYDEQAPMSMKLVQLPGVAEKVSDPSQAYNETWYADNLGASILAPLTISLFKRPSARLKMVVKSKPGDRFNADWNPSTGEFEVHVPSIYRQFFEQGQQYTKGNPLGHPIDAFLIWTLKRNLERAFNGYKGRTTKDFASFEKELSSVIWEYGTNVFERVKTILPRVKSQLLMVEHYALPSKKMTKGMLPAQLNQLLAAMGAASGQSATYWDKELLTSMEGQLRTGRLPAAKMIIKSLAKAQERAKLAGDIYMAQQFQTLGLGVLDALASNDQEIIQSQVTHTLACLLQSRDGHAALIALDQDIELTKEERANINKTTVSWIMSKETREQLLETAQWLLTQAPQGLIRQNLEFLIKALKQPVLNNLTSVKVLKLMQLITPKVEKNQAAVVGRDLTHVVGLVMDNTGIEQEVTVKKQPMVIVQPKVLYAFSTSPENIMALNEGDQLSQAVWVAPVNGRAINLMIKPVPGFDKIKKYLSGNEMYSSSLASDGAIAEAFYQSVSQGKAKKTKQRYQRQLIRTVIRVANHCAHLVDSKRLTEQAYLMGLLSMNRLMKVNWKTVVMGYYQPKDADKKEAIFAPRLLNTGGRYAMSYLWSQVPTFELIKAWLEEFMKNQLRNFRMNSAA